MSQHNYVNSNISNLARAIGQKIKAQEAEINKLKRITDNALIADNTADGDDSGRLINDYYSNYNNASHNSNKKKYMQVKLGLLPLNYIEASDEDWCQFRHYYEEGQRERREELARLSSANGRSEDPEV